MAKPCADVLCRLLPLLPLIHATAHQDHIVSNSTAVNIPGKSDACKRWWSVLGGVPVVYCDDQLLPSLQVQAEVIEALQTADAGCVAATAHVQQEIVSLSAVACTLRLPKRRLSL